MRTVQRRRLPRQLLGRLVAGGVCALAVVLVALPTSAAPGGTPGAGRPIPPRRHGPPPVPPTAHSHPVCGPSAPGVVHCAAEVGDRSDTDTRPAFASAPYGLEPTDIYNAYAFGVTSASGAGKTIGIVVAYDGRTAEQDLNIFSNEFALPTCSSSDGCFTKVNQFGASSPLPGYNDSWAIEASLDTQWAHALAPAARILLVEARSADMADVMTAVDYARHNADYVSMSWSTSESSSMLQYDATLTPAADRPNVSFFASSGDFGTPAEYPSSSPNVISVGGTTLSNITVGSATETGWSDSGGGCSTVEKAHPAQLGFAQYSQSGCNGRRATPDVSLVADPVSGVSVFNSGYAGNGPGWYRVGGTSASTPMWAGRAATDGAANGGMVDAARIYGSQAPQFRDITKGNNGATAKAGYDLVTGQGSWFDGTLPPGPSAEFTATCKAGSNACTFTAVTTSGVKYKWSGDDKLSGTSSRVNHTYRKPGLYTATLTVTGSTGTGTQSHQVSCALDATTNKVVCVPA